MQPLGLIACEIRHCYVDGWSAIPGAKCAKNYKALSWASPGAHEICEKAAHHSMMASINHSEHLSSRHRLLS